MSRGNRSEAIFQDEQDLETFERTLGEACEKTGFVVLAYTLMYNHYHIVLQTPEANLVAGMQWLQGTYTQRYNKRHGAVGHLFQGRYKSIPVDGRDSAYLQTVCNYVHLNPARAGLIGGETGYRVADYPWSSSWYLDKAPSNDPEWLDLKRICDLHVPYSQGSTLRLAYLSFLDSKVQQERDQESEPELYGQLRRGWAFGGDSFKETVKEKMADTIRGFKRSSHTGIARRAHDEAAALELIRLGLDTLDLREEELRSMKKNHLKKYLIAWLVRRKTPMKLDWIGEKLQMGSRANVSMGVKTIEESTAQDIEEARNRLLELYNSAG
ncbi:MAG: transposase [Verrucomicrobiota bacterium]